MNVFFSSNLSQISYVSIQGALKDAFQAMTSEIVSVIQTTMSWETILEQNVKGSNSHSLKISNCRPKNKRNLRGIFQCTLNWYIYIIPPRPLGSLWFIFLVWIFCTFSYRSRSRTLLRNALEIVFWLCSTSTGYRAAWLLYDSVQWYEFKQIVKWEKGKIKLTLRQWLK
jgi:hypothetical protein